MAMAMKPAASARTDLSSLAQTKLLLFSARRGRHAWPSWDMELASRTEKGSIPDANMVTNTICGLRDKSYDHGDEYHQGCVAPDPGFYVDIH